MVLPSPHPSGFRPRIRVRRRLFAGITMALPRPHKKMKRGPGFRSVYVGFAPPITSGLRPGVRGMPLIAGVTFVSAWCQELVSRVGAGVYPGSESGTCFHTNRSSKLAPAHQDMKIRCPSLEALGCRWRHLPAPLDSGLRRERGADWRVRER